MDLKKMQDELPKWSVERFDHVVTHAMVAVGRLAALLDDADHAEQTAGHPCSAEAIEARRRVFQENAPKAAKYVADLVVCAIKAAQLYPSGPFDLLTAVVARVREKNGPEAFPSAGVPAKKPFPMPGQRWAFTGLLSMAPRVITTLRWSDGQAQAQAVFQDATFAAVSEMMTVDAWQCLDEAPSTSTDSSFTHVATHKGQLLAKDVKDRVYMSNMDRNQWVPFHGLIEPALWVRL